MTTPATPPTSTPPAAQPAPLAPTPCPFCGSADIDVREGSTFRWRAAECHGCGAIGPEIRIQTMGDGTHEQWEADARERAFKDWNGRAPDPSRAALVAALRGLLRAIQNCEMQQADLLAIDDKESPEWMEQAHKVSETSELRFEAEAAARQALALADGKEAK